MYGAVAMVALKTKKTVLLQKDIHKFSSWSLPVFKRYIKYSILIINKMLITISQSKTAFSKLIKCTNSPGWTLTFSCVIHRNIRNHYIRTIPLFLFREYPVRKVTMENFKQLNLYIFELNIIIKSSSFEVPTPVNWSSKLLIANLFRTLILQKNVIKSNH